ncbi:MAG TPA: prohibitin family protein [Bacteroidales bacterium]|nr:prohibitin family protein [Bacteroidales bacterium]
MIFLKFLGWIILIYGIVSLIINMVQRSTNGKFKLPFSVGAIATGLSLVVLLSLIVLIDAQQVGVLVTPSGVKEDELHTGWHFVSPWNDVHKMDKTVWVYTCAQATTEGSKPNADAIWAPTRDGIKMGFDVSVSWRINPNEASWIYQNVTENDGGNSGRYLWLEDNVIRAKLKSALAITVSNYSPIEVYSSKREEIQQKVAERMKAEINTYKLILDQIDLREVYYNTEYEKAINDKKLAEQEALRLVEVTKQKEEQLKQAEIDKNIAIQKAEGEAKALQIKGTSVTNNPKMIQLEWINKWDGKLPQYMMGNGQGVILNLPNNQ